MGTLNVNPDIADAFYRYKMPRLLAKVEGKGNGIKTVIVNMSEIAKAIGRPPTYPTKFFGCELGAQTQFDLKNERFIVNGSHESQKLQELLFTFIRKFVLCPECDNPETVYSVKKSSIGQRCKACGYNGMVDLRHKLTTFILKNPPGQEQSGGVTPSKKDKKRDKKDKRGSKEVNGDGEPNDHDNSPPNEENDEDDVDWGEDVSEAAVQERMMQLTGAAKNMTISNDLEKTPSERADLFYEFVKRRKAQETVTGTDYEKEILGEAERLEVTEKAPLILVELLFTEKILTELKTYRNLLRRFTGDNPKSQKYLLGGIEQLVGVVHKDALLPKVPHILKYLYDMDIVEESVILEWDEKVSKKYVSKEISKEIHTKAEPFIKWLKEADEESSEESEDEVEVVYTNTQKVGVQKIAPPKKVEEEDDDLDIDNI